MTILQNIKNKIYEASFYVYTYIYSIDRYIHNRAY